MTSSPHTQRATEKLTDITLLFQLPLGHYALLEVGRVVWLRFIILRSPGVVTFYDPLFLLPSFVAFVRAGLSC